MEFIDRLYSMYFNGEILRLNKILSNVVQNYETDYRFWLLFSLVKIKMNELERALDYIEKSLELNANSIESWLIKSKILRHLGKVNDASKAIDKAIRLSIELDDYEDPELLLEKALILIETNKIKDAKNILKKILELNPEDEDAKALLSEISRGEKHD